MPDGADLEHHHADGVGDDVVELARDPRALLGHRDARRRLPLPLGLRRAHLRRFGLLGSLAQGEARDPADREHERGRRRARCGRGRGCCRRRSTMPPTTMARPIAACLRVAQVPEQERGRHPDDEEAVDERDQQPVDEGERRGQDPVRGRSGEGKAPAREERQHQKRDRGQRRTTAAWSARPASRARSRARSWPRSP